MFFIPFDMFKPYIQGRDDAIDRNWKDLFNSEKLRQDFVQTDTAEATMPQNIYATNQRNQYGGDQAGRKNELETIGHAADVASAGLNRDATTNLVGDLRGNDYINKYGSTMAGQMDTGLNRTQLGTDIQRAAINQLAPRADFLGRNTATNVLAKSLLGANDSRFALEQQPTLQQTQSACVPRD
jgi:hypothetical protein